MKISSIKFHLLVLSFRFALDFVYLQFVSPVYTNDFLSLAINFSLDRYLLSVFLYILSMFILSASLRKASDYFYLLYVLMIFAPLTSIWGMNTEKEIEPVLVTMLSLLLIYILIDFGILRGIRFPYFKNSRMIIKGVAWGFILYLVSWSFVSGAVFNLNFNPDLVYEFRDTNSSMLDAGFLSYLNIWTYKFFTIFVFLLALAEKRYILALFIISVQTYFYGLTAHKLVFFLPFFAFGVWFYFSKTRSLIVLPIIYNSVILISLLLYLVLQIDLAAAMLVRRVFYVPAGLTFEWFSFFNNAQYVYWSDTVLSFVIEYPYDTKLPFVVGNHLLGPELAANNGYVSTGFAQAGYFGVFVYTVILAVILKVLDGLGKDGVPLWLTVALTIGPIRTAISDSDLLTSLVSHGVLISLVMLILYREKTGNIKV